VCSLKLQGLMAYSEVDGFKVPADSFVKRRCRDTSWDVDTLGHFLNSLKEYTRKHDNSKGEICVS
jgi:hypothetical protein